MGNNTPCPFCAETISVEAIKCPHCKETLQKECPFCCEIIKANAKKCKHCGELVEKKEDAPKPNAYQRASPLFQPSQEAIVAKIGTNIDYYLQRFEWFDADDGRYVATWNWCAFLFGLIWYCYRGMWAKALIMTCVILAFAGIPGLIIWLYTGMFGNWDYYLYVKKGKQLW